MLKAPLTADATIANVEDFLSARTEQCKIALRIARYHALLARSAEHQQRERWLRWLRIVLVMDALGLAILAGYVMAGGAR